jgi:hypothetical protein
MKWGRWLPAEAHWPHAGATTESEPAAAKPRDKIGREWRCTAATFRLVHNGLWSRIVKVQWQLFRMDGD